MRRNTQTIDNDMPQRFLKPGITSSEHWNACSWQSQSFYVRLLTLVDDFGRFEANPKLLRSLAFPLLEDITSDAVKGMMEELHKNNLAVFYFQNDKPYVQLLNWTERPRAGASKYPAFDNTCKQMFSDVVVCEQMLRPETTFPAESCEILPPSSSSSSSYNNNVGSAKRKQGHHPDAVSVLEALNSAINGQYRAVDTNLTLISERLREPGVSADEVKLMIKRQCELWKGTDMERYLRPETLFRKSKFESYYAQRHAKVRTESSNPF
jgi:uncharacterized phage protein (TIGR02220 family)